MSLKNNYRIICLIIILFFQASLAIFFPAYAFSTKHALGDASEGFMQDYFKTGGWEPLEGQVGSQGIDGLFVKYDQNGSICDVLVAESKYNKSQLGRNLVCGERQMSNEWIQCKLDNLIKNSGDNDKVKKYEQIKTHVRNNNYRGLIWRTELKDGKLQVSLEKIKSKGAEIEMEDLRGGNKLKIQYEGNQAIDLKNPQNPYHNKIADSFYKNLDVSLERQGLSQAEKSALMKQLKENPHQIEYILHKYSPNIPYIATSANSALKHKTHTQAKPVYASSSISKSSQQIQKRAGKSLVKNVLKKGIDGATIGSHAGLWGAAIGFLGGVVVGITTDYLVDTTVDNVFADEKKPDISQESYRQEVERVSFMVEENIQTVHKRMEREFEILGNDIHTRHEAEMDAIQANFYEIQKVGAGVQRLDDKVGRIDNKLDVLHTDLKTFSQEMLHGIQNVRIALDSMNSTLTAMSATIDRIYERLDAVIKAKFDDGIEDLELFEKSGDIEHLKSALSNFRNVKNTFNHISDKTPEDEQMLYLTYYYLAVVYADLYVNKKDAVYAENSINTFMELATKTSELNFLTMTYLSIQEADISKIAAKEMNKIYADRIKDKLQQKQYNDASRLAESADIMLADQKSKTLKDAVNNYITNGIDESRVLEIHDQGYRMIMGFNSSGKAPSFYTQDVPDHIQHILGDIAEPIDFYRLLDDYQSFKLTRLAVRSLIKKNYYSDALHVLRKYPVGDDTFRVKAYLLIYKELDSPKFSKLRELVIQEVSYNQEVKDFEKRI